MVAAAVQRRAGIVQVRHHGVAYVTEGDFAIRVQKIRLECVDHILYAPEPIGMVFGIFRIPVPSVGGLKHLTVIITVEALVDRVRTVVRYAGVRALLVRPVRYGKPGV